MKTTKSVRIPSHFDHPFYKERQKMEKKRIRKMHGKTNYSKLPVGSRQCDMPINPNTGKRFCLPTKRKSLLFSFNMGCIEVYQKTPNGKTSFLFKQEIKNCPNGMRMKVPGTLSQMEGGMDNLANDRMLKELGIQDPQCGFYTVAFHSDGTPFKAWRNPRGKFLTVLEGRKF